MSNPNPRPENRHPWQRCDDSTQPLAETQVQVRLFRDIDALVRSLPNRSAWLRRVITEAAQRELMGGSQQ
ncbi:hypothetical protein [Pseudanabaena sp. PCC 6802]|uniref:hypothetical protein n=1 Tax=Pseudanabaena sp. PCC 6802 TaxID=118173 RepID=UPI00034D11F3|nr:hypothetical protein [Pseudanabaena sp. PCC 6802]